MSDLSSERYKCLMVFLCASQIASEAIFFANGSGMVRCKTQCSVYHSSSGSIIYVMDDNLTWQQLGQLYLPHRREEGMQQRLLEAGSLQGLHIA